MRRNTKRERCRPTVERLEAREVMAGGLVAFMHGPFLGVIGTNPSTPIVIDVVARRTGPTVQGWVVVEGVGIYSASQVKAVIVARTVGEPLVIRRSFQWNPAFIPLKPFAAPRPAPTPAPAVTPTPVTTIQPAGVPQESATEQAIVDAVNRARAQNGLPPLTVNPKLVQAAKIHANDMARLDQMAHDLPGAAQRTLLDRANYVGYNFSYLGENIAYGYPDVPSVMTGWMNSPGHRSNILGSEYTQIGVGVGYTSKGDPYYCQVFGRPA